MANTVSEHYRHNHGMCPRCRAERRAGCICPEQHPEIQWKDCPVHGTDHIGPSSDAPENTPQGQ